MGRKSHDPQLKRFLDYIRSQFCITCGGIDVVNTYGEHRVTVSHVKTKGSGGEYYNNCVPQCLRCHRLWEDSVKANKEEMLKAAKEWTERFYEEIERD